VHVVPMGVTVDDLGPWRRSEGLREELHRMTGSSSGSTLLFYAGRLSPEKNLTLLIDMMTRLGSTEARLVIAGDGPSLAALRQDAEQRAPGRVLFYGHVDARETLARLYASCDVFVHPNPREPFGIGPLEAMASGVPLVAPASGGLLSYASDANAWLAGPGGEAFARAVRAACQPGPDRDARLTRARETAAGYTWSNVTRTIFELYDRLHNKFAAPRQVVSRHADAICP
jgi:phosphatidylinositol alpha 1,6-mannosyltransferase